MFVIYSNKDFSKFPSSSASVDCTPLAFSPPHSLSLSLQIKIVSYLVKINIMGCKWHSLHQAITVSQQQKQNPGFSSPSCLACVGLIMLLTCTPVSLAVWGSKSVHCPFSVPTTHTHTSPFTSPLSLPPCLSLSLSLSQLKQTKDGGGRGVSWNTEGSLSGIFSYGFLQACILNTLCYNIFSYSTQGCWGTRGPHSVLSPTPFVPWPIFLPLGI